MMAMQGPRPFWDSDEQAITISTEDFMAIMNSYPRQEMCLKTLIAM
jgi:hypothetical protein